MIRRPPRALASLLLTGGLAVLLAAGDAEAQDPDRYLGVPPPLKAFGRALGELRDRVGKAAGSGMRQPARERKFRPPVKRGTPAAELKSARLPQPRPTVGAETTPEAGSVRSETSVVDAARSPAKAGRLAGLDAPSASAEPVSVEAKPPPLSAEARPPPAPRSSAVALEPPAARAPAPAIAALDQLARLPRARPEVQRPPAEAGTESAAEPQRASAPFDSAAPSEPESARAAADWLGRRPRPRPAEAPARLALVQPDLQLDDDDPPLAPAIPVLGADETACLARIETLGVAFTRENAITDRGACNVANPLSVTSIGSGVAITPAAILNCPTAEALALWTRDVMVPAAGRHLDARPDKLVNASAYVCRPRNNRAGSKLSEHATANAFDISALGFADRDPVAVESRGPAQAEGRFQRAIREGSCRYFTTVLGPGSNAAHATHFHFDMAERRGGYRLCDLGGTSTADRAPEKTKRE